MGKRLAICPVVRYTMLKCNKNFKDDNCSVGRISSRSRCKLASALSLLMICSFAGASSTMDLKKLDTPLQTTLSAPKLAGHVLVIVKFSKPLGKIEKNALTRLDVNFTRDLKVIGSHAVSLPTKNLERLIAMKCVERVSLDGKVQKNDDFSVNSSFAREAWQLPYNLTGKGVTVAVLDSGVGNFGDIFGRYFAGVAFNGGSASKDPCGHGTHVAGIVAGDGTMSATGNTVDRYFGIAKRSNILSVPVLGSNGSGNVSSVVAAIQYVIENKDKITPRVRIINLSLGHPIGESYKTDPLCLAVEAAWKSGLVVVCSAGNSGRLQNTANPTLDNSGYGTAYGTIQSPGNSPYAITVGASKSINGKREKDQIASYSSRGPSRLDYILKPDIIAPGNRIISQNSFGSFLEQSYLATNVVYVKNGKKVEKDYFKLSGTSMAAPVVAGAVAIMLEADPTLSPDTIKARLMLSADKWTDIQGTADPCSVGAGYVNIPAALNSKVIAKQYALSPSMSVDSFGNVLLNSGGFLDGNRAIWGTDVLDLRAVWGSRAIWGANSMVVDASRAIWGNEVWSDRAIWGVNSSNADISSIAINGE